MTWWAWIVLTAALGGLFAIDFLRFGRGGRPVSPVAAARWSVVWLVVGAAFTLVVWVAAGRAHAGQYLGGYLLERVLSIDNLAVLFVVLGSAGVPEEAQTRALGWGLVGALGLRAVLIVAGVALLQVVPGLAAVLGVALILTGIRLIGQKELVEHKGPGRLQKLAGRIVPSVADFDGRAMFVRRDGRLRATPLLTVIVAVMFADVVFALDSVPAVLSFSRVPWIVLAANAFALLGLRPLYFLVSGLIERLRYLKHGLGAVLGIAGARLILDEVHPIATWVELLAVVLVLLVAIGASLLRPREEEGRPARVNQPENRAR